MRQNQYTNDFYAQKAKKEGWAARSVYKLQEIHQKHLDFSQPLRVLDLGAAPGSWTQYLQKYLTKDSEIVAVDLHPLSISPHTRPKLVQLVADITEPATIETIISLGPYNYIISDTAPATTGNKSSDAAKSEQLVETIQYIAQRCLKEGGVLVAKLFQGSGTSSLLKQLRNEYKKVVCMHPRAVRASSVEVFLICS